MSDYLLHQGLGSFYHARLTGVQVICVHIKFDNTAGLVGWMSHCQ